MNVQLSAPVQIVPRASENILNEVFCEMPEFRPSYQKADDQCSDNKWDNQKIVKNYEWTNGLGFIRGVPHSQQSASQRRQHQDRRKCESSR